MSEERAIPTIKIKINGEELTLLYSMYALGKLKKIFGINALKGEIDILDPEHIVYFLWAGLISNHPEYDGDAIQGQPDKKLSEALKKLGSALTFRAFNDLGQAIRQAFDAATIGEKANHEEDESAKKN